MWIYTCIFRAIFLYPPSHITRTLNLRNSLAFYSIHTAPFEKWKFRASICNSAVASGVHRSVKFWHRWDAASRSVYDRRGAKIELSCVWFLFSWQVLQCRVAPVWAVLLSGPHWQYRSWLACTSSRELCQIWSKPDQHTQHGRTWISNVHDWLEQCFSPSSHWY